MKSTPGRGGSRLVYTGRVPRSGNMKALAVFHDHGSHISARFLKSGFRHVFVVVESGNYWIMIDGRAGVPVIEAVAAGGFDLARFYRDQGFTVIETEQRITVPQSPFAIANCVGLSKAVLSVRSCAITPWRLYKYLKNMASE